MNRRNVLGFSASSALSLAFLPGKAVAQQKTIEEQLVGTWNTLTIDAVRSDGSKVQLHGPSPKGRIVYGPDGHFSLIFISADLPKLASRNRAKATPEEATAIVAGSIAYFGKYSVDEKSKTITLDIEASTFANQVGGTTDNRRLITVLTANELQFTNPAATSGVIIEVTCRRAT